ncbi:ComEA family DNA-binding protein [Parapedobacter deserti]
MLSIFLLALWAAPRFYRLIHVSEDTDISAHIDKVEHFLSTATPKSPRRIDSTSQLLDVVTHLENIDYFTFDPNGLPAVEWKRLGLSDRQIRVIKNYEAKGGHFRVKEDLKKIYSIGDSDYARLAPYIHIPVKSPGQEAAPPTEHSESAKKITPILKERTALAIELNTADSTDLQQLPGIGPVYASRIVRFRNRLGGFHHVSQLMDVYGFDTLRFDGLKKFVHVDTSLVKKIALNTADYEALKAHPFISPKLANLIVQYRKQHGPYRATHDLLQIAVMDEENFRKIAPYVTLSDD